MQRYRDLRVWRESHAFLLGVYRVTAELPSEEKYGLTSQLRRAAVSVPTNIVEGARRQGRQDYVRFLNLAEASLAEAEYLLIVTVDLQYLSLDAVQPLLGAAGRIARKLYLLRSMVERFTHAQDRGALHHATTQGEATCLARSTPPSAGEIDPASELRDPDASAKREALNASGNSRDALNASAQRDALDASRDAGEPLTRPRSARRTPKRSP